MLLYILTGCLIATYNLQDEFMQELISEAMKESKATVFFGFVIAVTLWPVIFLLAALSTLIPEE